jgi:UDP-N-acetyl-2-amino-2-deoxyglucuronate dehydrogenase
MVLFYLSNGIKNIFLIHPKWNHSNFKKLNQFIGIVNMIKLGFLGCGRVAQRHIEVCRDELINAKVLAVFDTVNEKALECAKALDAECTDSFDQLLNYDLDAIVVLTESGKHTEHARSVLEAGKHVIVEKPAALLPNEIFETEKLAAKQGLMYSVILQNRLNPAMIKLKETFDKGRFGRLVLATIRLRWCRLQNYYEDGWHGTWKMDGGVINQQAIHHLDALQWICGPIQEVVAAQTNALNRLEAEDTTVATVKFLNGSLGVIEATTAARPEDFEASISVVGEKGMAVIGGIALNNIETWQFTEPQSEDETVPINFSQEVPTGYGLSHGPLMQNIVNRLNVGRTDPPITGTDASHCVSLAHALYRSVEVNGWVNLQDAPISERLGK